MNYIGTLLLGRPLRWLTLLALAFGTPLAAQPTVTARDAGGIYDPVTIDVEGPELDQAAGPNPFADYRLDVTFSRSGREYSVPGYFAACAEAADRGCTNGKLWRAHFVPMEAGEWTYRVSFRTGKDVVANDERGEAVVGIDGTTGGFAVSATPRNNVRARGLLQYRGEQYYRWSGTGRPFFKLGVDSPENMLAYVDFDRTPNARGMRHDWQPHVRDYDVRAKSFTWGNERGKGLLGRFAYLQGAGVNSVSMLLFNVGGDDQNVIPQVMRVSVDSYAKLSTADQWAKGVEHDRYDVVKLAQWQRALSYADELGLQVHFKMQEVENNFFMDGGKLGRERKIYIREMVARFNHFLAVSWNMGEENTQEPDVVRAQAKYIDSLDPYDHPLVMATYPRQKERFRPHLSSGSSMNGLAMQGATIDFSDMRPDIVKWTNASIKAGRRVVIGYDESGTAGPGAPIDAGFDLDTLPTKGVLSFSPGDIPPGQPGAEPMLSKDALAGAPPKFQPEIAPTRETYRRHSIWNALLAGAAGMEMYYGWTNKCHDLGCENDRTRALKFSDGRNAIAFFNEHVGERALGMVADDDLTITRTEYVFADHGKTYIVYTRAGTPAALSLLGESGRYSVDWYDAVAGGPLRKGSVKEISGGPASLESGASRSVRNSRFAPLGTPPSGGSDDWVALVRRIAD
ncbi:DUF5060 domain-containing protein [Sphingomonas soli]|uniref:DUF5060 domain-containing protein n=1 Tax=Sphingomonas soli TaxID=266127 RepID=UPI00146FEB27|nr:DUF5060 domain-containing protein [Sphingomonas soli]